MPESESASESEVFLDNVKIGVAYPSAADSDHDLAGTCFWLRLIADLSGMPNANESHGYKARQRGTVAV